MRKRAGAAAPTKNRIRRSAFVTVICDVILIMALTACLFLYVGRNNINTYQNNIKSITNIAAAESELLKVAFDNTGFEVKSAYNYCDGKSVAEILDYLSLIIDDENEYQLLKRDDKDSTDRYHVYYGYSTKKENGEYMSVRYRDTALAGSIYKYATRPEGQISFSQTFTNNTDALRYYAVFCAIDVLEQGQPQRYYLVKPQKESKMLDQLRSYSQYSELGLAICYSDGKYLACDDSFRGDNFYDYLYKYNDLSIDERNAIRASVQNDSDGAGALVYKDSKGRDSVFAYAACGVSEDWYVIISVPSQEFVSSELLSFFPLIVIVFLVVLLVFNVWRLLGIVGELRLSVEREQVANTAKSSFLSRMSHEIRTPLNAILGYNTIARSEMTATGDEAARKQAEMKVMDCLLKSEIASKHLLTIINDVLDMSAIESGKIKVAHDRFDFKGLITSLTTVFYSQARAKGVEFEVVFDTLTEEWFVGDQVRVNQILTNLLSNAVKFTPDGGSVTLRIHQPEAASNASHIRFEVEDTGIGMTQDYISHIWTPFEQADSSISRRFGGTGLGLSITKNLVDLMGGEINVTSAQGVGSVFSVDLTFERTEQPENANVYDFSSVNALIVDDDMSTCDYVRLLFNRCGARCAAVTSGADAVKAVSVAKERGESFTLCLVDWQMPGMDGIETIRQIKEIVGDEMPMVVLTAYDYTELADKTLEIGTSRFISKPLFQSSLFDLLADISGSIAHKGTEHEKGADFKGARVILAEDNVMNMEIAKEILEAAELVVDSAWNGREAVKLFEASEPGSYMAILMDVHMPEMDGHEATRTIRVSSHPDGKSIPIIAMTADAFAENVAEAYASGMNDHISKPIDIQRLLETLGKYAK